MVSLRWRTGRGRGLVFVFSVSMICSLFLAPAAYAQTPTGLEIMTWVDERDDGDDGITDMEMILIDKNGNQRVRELRSYSKDFGEDTYSIMFFLTPADVKDTGFLSYDYDEADKDDDQWLYLPALKKTKRIASGDKSGSFMGSDFTYSDLSSRNLEAYDYKLLQESEVGGVPVWVVEAIPKTKKEIDETGYTKSIAFVRKDNHVVIRGKHWVKRGKRNKYFDVKKLEQIDGIWVPTELTMTTKKGSTTIHKTVIKMSNVHFNQGLSEDLFTTRRLEKGL